MIIHYYCYNLPVIVEPVRLHRVVFCIVIVITIWLFSCSSTSSSYSVCTLYIYFCVHATQFVASISVKPISQNMAFHTVFEYIQCGATFIKKGPVHAEANTRIRCDSVLARIVFDSLALSGYKRLI